jgi:hypothetical protein
MRGLLPIDAPAAAFSLPADATPNRVLDSGELQRLGDQLRLTYGPVEAHLPARLAELVERLARCERPRNYVSD